MYTWVCVSLVHLAHTLSHHVAATALKCSHTHTHGHMARSWLFVSTPDISDKLTPLSEWKCAARWGGRWWSWCGDGCREAARRWIISFTRCEGEQYHSETHTQTHKHTCDITGMQKTCFGNDKLRWRKWRKKEAREWGAVELMEGEEDGGQGQMKDKRKKDVREADFRGWEEAKERESE